MNCFPNYKLMYYTLPVTHLIIFPLLCLVYVNITKQGRNAGVRIHFVSLSVVERLDFFFFLVFY